VGIAPETLYSEATGEPLPAWMTKATEVQKEIYLYEKETVIYSEILIMN
jgi:hypothetical protein